MNEIKKPSRGYKGNTGSKKSPPIRQKPLQQKPLQQTPLQQTPLQKTPEQKKPEQKKPEQKKPEQKKPEQKTRPRRNSGQKPHEGPERKISNPAAINDLETSLTIDVLNLLIETKDEIDIELKKNMSNSTLQNIQKKMNNLKKKYNLITFGRVGDSYDPRIYDAVLFMKSEQYSEKKVIEIRTKGIKSNRKTIVKCKVIVSK